MRGGTVWKSTRISCRISECFSIYWFKWTFFYTFTSTWMCFIISITFTFIRIGSSFRVWISFDTRNLTTFNSFNSNFFSFLWIWITYTINRINFSFIVFPFCTTTFSLTTFYSVFISSNWNFFMIFIWTFTWIVRLSLQMSFTIWMTKCFRIGRFVISTPAIFTFTSNTNRFSH